MSILWKAGKRLFRVEKRSTIFGILKNQNNMNALELLEIIGSGETSKVQFKRTLDNQDSFAAEMIVPGTTVNDIDKNKVKEYLNKIIDSEKVELNENVYRNLNILKDNSLSLGGLLFFAKEPQKYRPAFCIKAVSFVGNDLGGNLYRDSQDIVGTIPDMFNQAVSFFTRNLHYIQKDKNFNSVGDLEISKIALEELLQNALTHRDYTKNSPIRLFIFDNRVEIISPGALPNNLTIENIKLGNAVVRNNLVVSFSSKLMNYRGVGTGVARALKEQPNIEFENDVEGEQFKVVIPRPQKP